MQLVKELQREQVREQKQEQSLSDSAMSKENTLNKATEKHLRTPRTRRFIKALKQADLPSLEDEKVLERLRQEAVKNGEVSEEEVEELVFTPVEIEEFRKKVEVNVAAIIEKELQQEHERIQREKWKKEDMILAPCGIDGCKVHSLNSHGNIVKHFSNAEYKAMSGYQKRAADIVVKYQGWSYVEMNAGVITHYSEFGDVIKIITYDAE